MELLKEAGEHKIFKKRSGKYAVQDKKGKFINGQPKVEILVKAGVVKQNAPKKKEEAAPAPSEG